jgi:hypothetical protein
MEVKCQTAYRFFMIIDGENITEYAWVKDNRRLG